MGIKRLTTFLTSHHDPVAHPPSSLPPGSRLLIDASGWAYVLQEACVARGARQDHLGDYRLLADEVRAAVGAMRAAGLVPILYTDGPTRRMKTEATKRRRLQRDGKWELLQGTCLDGQKVKQADLPEPPLMLRQVLATAASLRVELVNCAGEADQDMALACAERRHGGPAAYVLGLDSDFYLFRGCSYIRFEDISFVETSSAGEASRAGTCSPHAKVARAIVWTRAILSEMTSLNEAQLVEWAILLGNDYTAQFGRHLYDNELLSELGSDEHDPEAVREFVAEQQPELRLESRFANVQRAIEFSRALYQLQDLSVFPTDAADDDSEEEEVFALFCAVFLLFLRCVCAKNDENYRTTRSSFKGRTVSNFSTTKMMNFSFKLVDFVLKMMNFSFKLVDFVFKMMNFAFKLVDFVFKMMNF